MKTNKRLVYVITTIITCIAILVAVVLLHEKKSACVSVLRSKGTILVRIISSLGNTHFDLYKSAWPSDHGFDAHTSVQYFKILGNIIDSETSKSENFCFSLLVDGWYTRESKSATLAKDNVVWSVAKNIPANAPDNLPVLMTRNIDVSSLSSNVSENDMKKRVTIDRRYNNAFDRSFAVVVYADRSAKIFDVTDQNLMTYSVFYKGTSLRVIGLKYLTPVEEVDLER